MKMGPPTIPVIIDSIKNEEGFPFTRCFYFCIETTTPAPGWLLETKWYNGPVLMLGMSAIILGPLNGEPLFGTTGGFGEMVEALDQDDEDFYLDQNAIWLPNSLFMGDGHERGAVYRVSLEAFRPAYNFTEHHLDTNTFLEQMHDRREDVVFSPQETEAFQKWDADLLLSIQEEYHANPDMVLRKKDDTPTPKLG
ncbi:MAG: hypothetical protein COB46_08700 [Rhodospirillaceae bacterium]|nr:MAG: hypothetical protein COB46_08700 [Rhodospirillaceae bacterium]